MGCGKCALGCGEGFGGCEGSCEKCVGVRGEVRESFSGSVRKCVGKVRGDVGRGVGGVWKCWEGWGKCVGVWER